jgi:signal transduction histidine kinase
MPPTRKRTRNEIATAIPTATAMLSSKFMDSVSAGIRTFLRLGLPDPSPLCNHRAMPASAIPSSRAARPATRRTRLRPVAFAVLVALVPTALVAWAVGRSQADQVSRAASEAVVAEAQAGRQEAERVLAKPWRKRALAIARLTSVQRALARRDRAALKRLARRYPGSYFLVRGRAIPARLPAAARRTAVVTLGTRPIGTVVVAVGRPALLKAISTAPVKNGDRLLLADPGTAPARAADIHLGDTRYRAAGAPLSSQVEVVAARPGSVIDEDVRNTWLTVFGAALATLATVAVIALAASPFVVRGRMAQRERSEALRVLSSVNDGVFLTDDGGLVRFWNRAAELITGLTRRDVWGRALADLPGLGSIAGEIPVGEEGSVRPQVFPVQLGLRELWLSLTGVQTGEGTVYTFADVTEEHRLEQLKNDFVATVSHELRTPLTGLYGAVMTLRERGDEIPVDDRSDLLATLAEQAKRLARLVEDLLVASGIESDRLLLGQERFEAVALAREVVDDARRRHETARVQLVEEQEAYVLADPLRTRQVLENLIDNAVKYADRGPVRVAVEVADGLVTFGVSDEGPGIPEDRREQIFEKFYRSDVQMEGGVGGAGLGLYISRELVRRMGGRLWVESTSGAGSRFSFELPSIPS